MFSNPEKNLEQLSIDPGMSVVDLGCGTGNYSIPAARMVGTSGRVYALDVQQELLTKLKNEALAQGVSGVIDVVWADVDEPDGSRLREGTVDRTIVANILFQVEKNEMLVREAVRVTKRGGMILLIDWSDSFGGLGPQPSALVSQEEARKLFEDNGATHVRDISAGDHHYGMVFKK